jgi:D-alanyl-lipoteichoic acid acyltransferase DltB (MBOAT superfamily)
MLSGLVQKVVVANQLSLIVTPVYDKLNSSEGWMLILVIIANPLYLYFDFSGYTNIALGLARIFGVELLPNFNKPFLSENVTGFWKRFHMSLSLWFNDYVFKQASFRLRGYKSFASVIAVFITWFLFGIWHGAGWNFMVLGVIQAIAIIYEFYTKKQRYKVFSRLSPFLKKWIGRIITYLFFGVSLVFFFSTDLKSSVKFFSGLKSLALEIPSTTAPIIISDKISFFIALIIMIGFLFMELLSVDHDRIYQRIDNLWKSNKTRVMLLRYSIYYFAIALVFYFGGMQSEFVYFQF